MKVIWISCLLIGVVVCGPVRMGPRSGGADPRSGGADPRFRQQPRYGLGLGSGGTGGNSGSDGSSSPQSRIGYGRNVPAPDAGSFSQGKQDFYSTTTDELDDGNRGYARDPEESRYAASAFYAADPADDGDDDEEEELEIEDFLPVPEVSEPIFSDVSDLDPVYAFSSRSRYFRKKKVLYLSRYTPRERAAADAPPPPPGPVMNRLSPSQQSRPADPPKKYIYG